MSATIRVNSVSTKLLTILVPKLEHTAFYYTLLCLKTAGQVANSVDPDQMPQNAASGQGPHCLLRPFLSEYVG